MLAHELAHVAQFAREGSARFLLRYVREYVRGRRRGLSHPAAYGAISFEEEARRAEENGLETVLESGLFDGPDPPRA